MSDPAIPEFPDVPAFVETLNRHGVRYVVIGGAAAQFSVAGLVTHDVDFTPATVVASKKLANRPKDQLVLPQLDQALAERGLPETDEHF